MGKIQKETYAVNWTASALADLQSVWHYLTREASSAVAIDVGNRIMDDTDKLEDFPRIGRRGEAEGTHELVLPSLPYRLVYEVDDGKKEVRILRVMHTSRRWPEE